MREVPQPVHAREPELSECSEAVVIEVHATWTRGSATLCGETGYRVVIRAPADWEMISCPVCHYAAGKGEA